MEKTDLLQQGNTPMQDDKTPITRQKFMEELRRYQKGSVTRRHFLGVTGLGTAMAVMGGALPML